jgi:hypothetical protein
LCLRGEKKAYVANEIVVSKSCLSESVLKMLHVFRSVAHAKDMQIAKSFGEQDARSCF